MAGASGDTYFIVFEYFARLFEVEDIFGWIGLDSLEEGVGGLCEDDPFAATCRHGKDTGGGRPDAVWLGGRRRGGGRG